MIKISEDCHPFIEAVDCIFLTLQLKKTTKEVQVKRSQLIDSYFAICQGKILFAISVNNSFFPPQEVFNWVLTLTAVLSC